MNSVITPAGVMRPMRPGLACSLNQTLPSGPAAIPNGSSLGVSPAVNSAMTPAGVMRPIAPDPPFSVNQRPPSGPVAIAHGL